MTPIIWLSLYLIVGLIVHAFALYVEGSVSVIDVLDFPIVAILWPFLVAIFMLEILSDHERTVIWKRKLK